MGVFDNELLLPGVVTDIINEYSKDYNPVQFGTTDSVVILGTAFNGPVGKPIPVYSVEHARYIFGDVYDYRSKKQASLVASIEDCYNRGCRTIYAVRISGKEIYKDFQFKSNSKLQLRVLGNFPSNDNKDVYMYYNDREGASTLSIYKPAKRATIAEKKQGLVEKEDSIISLKLDISNSYGFTKETRLLELINIVNSHTQNNVLKLLIVDDEGVDVTYSSPEAQEILIGDLFPGAYFIGRDKNTCNAITLLNYEFTSESNKPYESYSDLTFKKLDLNTDVNKNLPIYSKNVRELNEIFNGKVVMTQMFDFLQIPGKVDLVFAKDKIDYEEVDLNNFEIYKRLGSGFAVTAKCEARMKDGEIVSDIKVKETSDSDSNKIQPITDGIYSILENFNARYRVLAGVNCDDKVVGPIPKKKDFEVVVGESGTIYNKMIDVNFLIDKKDIVDPKKYKFKLVKINEADYDVNVLKEKTYTHKIAKRASKITSLDEIANKSLPDGTYIVTEDADKLTLHSIVNGKPVKLDNPTVNSDLKDSLLVVNSTLYKGSVDVDKIVFEKVTNVTTEIKTGIEYVLVENFNNISVYNLKEVKDELGTTTTSVSVVAVGAIDEVFEDSDDKLFITVESDHLSENVISILSSTLDFTTLEEFIEILNTNKSLSHIAEFSINNDHILSKDEYIYTEGGEPECILELDTLVPVVDSKSNEIFDRFKQYDLNLYIPFKTHDNFARQLAQHCQYTSLKTAPAEGFIGVSKLQNTNLSAVAKRVESLIALDLNLYAKTQTGKDILNKDNMPYSIGRKINIIATQYPVVTNQNYTFISNGAAGYAGMVSALPLDHSSTNQPISVDNIDYEYSNYQLGKLTQKGFVTIKQSYTKGFVITDGITMADSNDQFKRLSTARITGYVEELIRAACEPFIGKQNNDVNKNSMETSIKSSLDSIKDTLLADYRFTLISDINDANLGIVNIDYRIFPINEIREVRNNITVSK